MVKAYPHNSYAVANEFVFYPLKLAGEDKKAFCAHTMCSSEKV